MPACHSVPVAVRPAVFQKFQQETLLRFYSMPGTNRSSSRPTSCACGRFPQGAEGLDLRVAGTEPVMKRKWGARGSLRIFDVMSWERIRKDNQPAVRSARGEPRDRRQGRGRQGDRPRRAGFSRHPEQVRHHPTTTDGVPTFVLCIGSVSVDTPPTTCPHFTSRAGRAFADLEEIPRVGELAGEGPYADRIDSFVFNRRAKGSCSNRLLSPPVRFDLTDTR